MADLSSLSPQLDTKKCTCRAIIETPKGCRNKFTYDPDSGLFMLGGLLPDDVAIELLDDLRRGEVAHARAHEPSSSTETLPFV